MHRHGQHGTSARCSTLEWTPAGGDWTAVVMPTDRSAGLSVDLALAATAPTLPWLSGGLVAGGAVLLAGGTVLIALAVHRAQASSTPASVVYPGAPPGPQPDLSGAQPPPPGDPRLTPSGGLR